MAIRLSEKRKNGAMKTDAVDSRGTEQKKAKQSVGKPEWHPNFGPSPVTVVFVSSDKQKFSVDKRKLAQQSGFFRDMFTLPVVANADADQAPISIDETAHDLDNFFSHVIASVAAPITPFDMASGIKVAEMAVKYDAPAVRQKCIIQLFNLVEAEPFETFAFASHRDDIPLAKMAISSMTFRTREQADLFALIADAKPAWQLALLKSMMPAISQGSHDRTVRVVEMCLVMKDIASNFKP